MICVIIHEKLRGNSIQGTCPGDQVKIYIIKGKCVPEQLKFNVIWGKWTLFRNSKIYSPWLIIIFYRIHLICQIRQKSKQKEEKSNVQQKALITES